jgi:hypothetical protein
MARVQLTRIQGMPEGSVDPDRDEIVFTLQASERKIPMFVAKSHVVEQIAMGLSGLLRGLIDARQKLGIPFAARPVHAEEVIQYAVTREPFADKILLYLVAENGIPYTFAVPKDAAADIVARLQTEIAKTAKPGTA